MYGQHVRDVAIGNKVGNFSVAVAGYVLQRGVACGPFVEPLYGNDGEKLVDSPAVGQRLEKREVAEVLVG